MPRTPNVDKSDHRGLVEHVGMCVRKMGAQSVIASKTIADRFTLHTTDLEVLDLIFLRSQASAGELAAATGLTSGSITALIDRLVTAGYVERRADPGDRRRVMVQVVPAAIEPIKNVYLGMQQRMFELWSEYSSDQLEIIADFLTRSTELHVECLKDLPPADPSTRQLRARSSRSSGTGAE